MLLLVTLSLRVGWKVAGRVVQRCSLYFSAEGCGLMQPARVVVVKVV